MDELHGAGPASHEGFRRAAEVDGQELWPTLEAVVVAARKQHRTALERLGLAGACPEEAAEVRTRLLEYAEKVADETHAPLRDALSETPPLATTAERWTTERVATLDAVRALPVRVDLPVEADALGAKPGDGVVRSTGRMLARLRFSVGGTPSSRPVDVRAVARRHVHRRVLPLWGTVQQDRMLAWARWMGAMEAGWAGWAERVLPVVLDDAMLRDDPTGAWAAVAAAANALDTTLRSLEERPVDPPDAALESASVQVARWEADLQDDLEVAGLGPFRTSPSSGEPPRGPRFEAWVVWEAQVVGRFELHAGLLDAVDTVRAMERLLTARLRADAMGTLAGAAAEAAEVLEALAEELGSRSPLPEDLEDSRARARTALDGVEAARPVAPVFDAAAQRAADSGVARLQSLLRSLPADVELHTPAPRPAELREPPRDSRTVRLQEVARQAFDALRMERVRTAPGLIRAAAPRLAASLDEVGEVVDFGFDAAVRERDEEDPDAETRARALVVEGLSRAAGLLRAVSDPVDDAVEMVRHDLRRDLTAGCDRMVERALAHRVQGRLLDARGEVVRRISGVVDRMRPGAVAARRRATAIGLWLQRQGRRFLRRGQSLVGAGPVETGAALRTARSLASADTLMDELPLVYQRLFSSDPVDDVGLLVGREGELADAEARWRRWHDEDGVPVILTGARGTGMSSFVRAFCARMEAGGAGTVHHELRDRFASESELAPHLAGLLGLEACGSLDALAAAILVAPWDSLPDLVALEGLEHLYLRVPAGTDLVERVLTLMSETEPRIFWLGTMNTSAWQLVEKSEPTAVGQVDRMHLAPLGAEGLRDTILSRHRRSGLLLHFEEPTEGRRMLRRRLARARGQESRSRLLAGDYFERLERSSQGNLRLAMFQWLRSADFTSREGETVVRPPPPLDFSFLAALDLIQNFTLKAFLEHRTLTLAEHDHVFRLPRQESYQIFEGLGHRHIIRPVPGRDETRGLSEVEDEIRYEIRPLLVRAVHTHLAGQNIVH
ncbi:MAG: ATP-binding protein [Longimicrobiales bacterium]